MTLENCLIFGLEQVPPFAFIGKKKFFTISKRGCIIWVSMKEAIALRISKEIASSLYSCLSSNFGEPVDTVIAWLT